ncbi:MAG TPA: glycosyltransferase family 2 protein [Candidatus Dormibacteraeota bacterium]|jgi:cellulose synthase/poly-beta-1,6-N-acetylglucosamine synthase-like glycosyltransferase|nr:glycosyltransferase family 2 protein [Candidatus Dormibacteraeota bacterium]
MDDSPRPSVTVIISAYTERRWPLLSAAVASVRRQSPPPDEIIVCVDHNPDLLGACRREWPGTADGDGPPVRCVASRYPGHLGAARTTGVESASGEVVLFLDDDAVAEDGWLQRMVAGLMPPSVVAVGGAPQPDYERPRPRWFPFEFDWVFGCAYAGLPTVPGPVARVIGAAMAARRCDLLAIGGFHSDDLDDLDMSHRLQARFPERVIMYEPGARVSHRVHAERLTWSYFWHRCFRVNRGKAQMLRMLGGAGNLAAERRFAGRTVTSGTLRCLREAATGDVGGLQRLAAMWAGLGLAALGYAVGSLELTGPPRSRMRQGTE